MVRGCVGATIWGTRADSQRDISRVCKSDGLAMGRPGMKDNHSCFSCANAKPTADGIVCSALGINLSKDFADIFYARNTCRDHKEGKA